MSINLRSGWLPSKHSAKCSKLCDPQYSRIFKAIDFIEANVHRRLTVEEVARECAYSTDYFSRLFKHALGMAPSHYIQKTKCELAKNMLFSELTCSQIADELSFVSPSHFVRVFGALMLLHRISGFEV